MSKKIIYQHTISLNSHYNIVHIYLDMVNDLGLDKECNKNCK